MKCPKCEALKNQIRQYRELLNQSCDNETLIEQMELFAGASGMLMFVPDDKIETVKQVLK